VDFTTNIAESDFRYTQATREQGVHFVGYERLPAA
jgi:hypothetical protein